jgi:hypothetical protein
MRNSALPAALALVGMLAACESAPPRPTYPDIHFTAASPIRLAVSGVDVRSEFKPTFRSPNVEHLFPVPPSRAAENWAHDRLQVSSGGAHRARFTIQDASVTETELPKKTGLTATFTKEPAEQYDATLAVMLEIVDDHGVPLRSVAVKVTRSHTVLEGITPNERDQAWYDMTKMLMADFDQQMTAEISAHFGGFFQ